MAAHVDRPHGSGLATSTNTYALLLGLNRRVPRYDALRHRDFRHQCAVIVAGQIQFEQDHGALISGLHLNALCRFVELACDA